MTHTLKREMRPKDLVGRCLFLGHFNPILKNLSNRVNESQECRQETNYCCFCNSSCTTKPVSQLAHLGYISFLKLALDYCTRHPTFWLIFLVKKLSARKCFWRSIFSPEKQSQSWAQGPIVRLKLQEIDLWGQLHGKLLAFQLRSFWARNSIHLLLKCQIVLLKTWRILTFNIAKRDILNYFSQALSQPQQQQSFSTSNNIPTGECPNIATLPNVESCNGQASNCWSVGQADVDCPNNALCCFDGCVNTCYFGGKFQSYCKNSFGFTKKN